MLRRYRLCKVRSEMKRLLSYAVAVTFAIVLSACILDHVNNIFAPSIIQNQSQGNGQPSPSPSPSPNACGTAIVQVNVAGPNTWVHGTQQSFTVTAVDQFGNDVASTCPTPLTASWNLGGVLTGSAVGSTSGLTINVNPSVAGTGSLQATVFASGAAAAGFTGTVFSVTVQ
jgi:hypothetical protein